MSYELIFLNPTKASEPLLDALSYVNKNYFPFAQACFSAFCALKAQSKLKKTLTNPYKKGCCQKAAWMGYHALTFTTYGYLALLTTENKCQALANLVLFTNLALINAPQKVIIKKIKEIELKKQPLANSQQNPLPPLLVTQTLSNHTGFSVAPQMVIETAPVNVTRPHPKTHTRTHQKFNNTRTT